MIYKLSDVVNNLFRCICSVKFGPASAWVLLVLLIVPAQSMQRQNSTPAQERRSGKEIGEEVVDYYHNLSWNEETLDDYCNEKCRFQWHYQWTIPTHFQPCKDACMENITDNMYYYGAQAVAYSDHKDPEEDGRRIGEQYPTERSRNNVPMYCENVCAKITFIPRRGMNYMGGQGFDVQSQRNCTNECKRAVVYKHLKRDDVGLIKAFLVKDNNNNLVLKRAISEIYRE